MGEFLAKFEVVLLVIEAHDESTWGQAYIMVGI